MNKAVNNNNNTMSLLLKQAYLEAIPTPLILDRLEHIPRHAYLSITCSPKHGLEPTLQLVEQLRSLPEQRQLKLVPHIAARLVRDKGHLREVVSRLEAAQVESVFVPGGDALEPAGIYQDSLVMLRDMAELGHGIEDVGIAAHPEGHPFVSDDKLLWFLEQKQPYATYLVTQMCFDSQAIISWVRHIRRTGITLPVWIGLPGVADRAKLVSLSLRMGVGQSVRLLKKQKGLLKNMTGVKPYQPDDLLAGFEPYISDGELNIPGFHLFSFNDIERTEKWRVDTSENYAGKTK